MKRVVPDIDKNLEPLDIKDTAGAGRIFNKSWFPISELPKGMNYYNEPIEHLDIDGKIAILYTLNDYSDMFSMDILPDDQSYEGIYPKPGSPLYTQEPFLKFSAIFYRNFDLPACLACQRLGMNVVGYLLVRFDDMLLLAPP
jgi:hypothetical protein